MEENIAQKPEAWGSFWEGRTPYHEFPLKDTYGERPYVLKYVPRFGRVIEAGSGLGRVSFYLEKMGIDIIGVDFSKKDLCQCRAFARTNDFTPENFVHGDILDLPFDDNSCTGYLSFGVVEHFIEGPQKALKEAFRVLKPGGILVLTTPNRFAIYRLYGNFKKEIKFKFKKFLNFLKGRKIGRPKEEFWQYWYSKDQLREFTERQGFKTVISENFGLKSSFDWLIRSPEFRPFLISRPLVMRISNFLEKSFLRNFSANSVVVSYKPGLQLQCFFSGTNTETIISSDIDVPISKSSLDNVPSRILEKYRKGRRPFFEKRTYYPASKHSSSKMEKNCSYCKKNYLEDYLIDMSFSKPVGLDCLQDPLINIEIGNCNLEEKWVPWK
jgi:SAM-dependent methyltransferase